MTNQERLNKLIADFQQWRTTRKHPTAKTPQPLRDEAVKLAQYYSPGQIQAALKIASSTFCYWRKKVSAVSESNDFITLPEVSEAIPAQTPDNTTMTVELNCKNGNSLQLSGAISLELLTVITREVLA